jgi:hypothetical protein
MTDEMSLAVFDPIKAQLAELAAKDESLVFDHTTEDGERNLRSYVYRLRSHKTAIADLHRTTKKGALEFGRKVDAVKNELTAGVQAIIDERMKPLDEIEDAKRKAAEAIVAAEEKAAQEAEEKRLADLKRREEEVTAKEAEQKAKETAAKVEADKAAAVKEAVALGERNTQDAIAAEQEKTRQANAAEEAEKKRLADIDMKRIANKRHRQKIRGNAIATIEEGLGELFTAEQLVAFIDEGHCKYLSINY